MSSNVIDSLMRDISKGKIPVMRLDDDDSPSVVRDWVSSGNDVLDLLIKQGFPVGRIVEIYGDESTGKSLLGVQAVAEAQANGCIAVYIDTEHAASRDVMQGLGVDISTMLYSDPDSIEDVFQFMENVIKAKEKNAPDKNMIIVWDSVAATPTKAELAADYEKTQVGTQARAISAGLRKIVSLISNEHVCVIMINQTRQKIGVVFGDPETTSGGKSIAFYASVRIRLKRGAKIKSGKKIIGINTYITITKNKVGRPFGEVTLPIYFEYGSDNAETMFNYLKDNDLLDQSGAWYGVEIGGETVKFQAKTFQDVYDKHHAALISIIKESLE